MELLKKIDHWSETHQNLVMDVLRFILGVVIFIKGVEFGQHPKDVLVLVNNTPFEYASWIIVHYIIIAHLAGGAFIMSGFLTRLAIIFQLPVVICAALFIQDVEMFSFYSSRLQALLILLFLIIFLFYGSGKRSLDTYFENAG